MFRAATCTSLRVDIRQLVHAGWQISLYVIPKDGLYLVHGHIVGWLVPSKRTNNNRYSSNSWLLGTLLIRPLQLRAACDRKEGCPTQCLTSHPVKVIRSESYVSCYRLWFDQVHPDQVWFCVCKENFLPMQLMTSPGPIYCSFCSYCLISAAVATRHSGQVGRQPV